MAEFADKRCARWVSRTKDGTVKVVSFEGSFTGTDRKNGPLETSNLYRFVVKANQKAKDQSFGLNGNIPVEKIPEILLLSQEALKDKKIDGGKKAFPIYEGEARPSSQVDEKGNKLIYQITVNYSGSMASAICFSIKNFYAPVNVAPDGRTLVQYAQRTGEQEIKLFMTVDGWYNQLANSYQAYTDFRTLKTMQGEFDSAFGLNWSKEEQ